VTAQPADAGSDSDGQEALGDTLAVSSVRSSSSATVQCSTPAGVTVEVDTDGVVTMWPSAQPKSSGSCSNSSSTTGLLQGLLSFHGVHVSGAPIQPGELGPLLPSKLSSRTVLPGGTVAVQVEGHHDGQKAKLVKVLHPDGTMSEITLPSDQAASRRMEQDPLLLQLQRQAEEAAQQAAQHAAQLQEKPDKPAKGEKKLSKQQMEKQQAEHEAAAAAAAQTAAEALAAVEEEAAAALAAKSTRVWKVTAPDGSCSMHSISKPPAAFRRASASLLASARASMTAYGDAGAAALSACEHAGSISPRAVQAVCSSEQAERLQLAWLRDEESGAAVCSRADLTMCITYQDGSVLLQVSMLALCPCCAASTGCMCLRGVCCLLCFALAEHPLPTPHPSTQQKRWLDIKLVRRRAHACCLSWLCTRVVLLLLTGATTCC
jgi:hypothetical protein